MNNYSRCDRFQSNIKTFKGSHRDSFYNDFNACQVKKECGFPCVVKPNRGSASTGVSKVHDRKGIKEAVDFGFKHDSQVVIESCVSDGVEVSCTVHDITADELLEAFPVTEITPEGEFFHTSSHSAATAIMTPARNLRGEVILTVTKVAKVAYRALNLCGLATFDMIVQVWYGKYRFWIYHEVITRKIFL